MFDVELWRKKWRRGSKGDMMLALGEGTEGPSLEVMMAAADEVVASINRRYRSLSLWDPSVSTYGPVTSVERSTKWPEFEQMVGEYAAALTAVGVSGVLCDDQPFPPGGHWRHTYRGVGMGVALHGDLVPSANGVRLRRIAEPDVFEGALSVIRQWCGELDGVWWVNDQMGVARVEPDRVDDVVDLVRRRTPVNWGWQVVAENTIRHAQVELNGHLACSVKSRGPLQWEAGVELMTDLLCDLAPFIEYGFLSTEQSVTPTWSGLVMIQWSYANAMAEAQYPLRVAWESHLVRNAYPVQLLGPGHVLPPLPDRWQITPLPSGQHLVRATDLPAWSGDHITKDFIQTANTEFGPLIPPD